jgi:CheY-like chemotaxis protein
MGKSNYFFDKTQIIRYHFYISFFRLKMVERLAEYFKQKAILIVDDDYVSALLLQEHLRPLNTELLVAHTTCDAINLFKTNPKIALVLLDIKFHVGNGYEVAKQMRVLNPEVILIAQTALAIEEERQKLINSCFNSYIFKPILSNVLFDTILKNIL